MDSYKTELIADRVWRSRSQLELATVEWVAWFNHERLHESLGDIPPVEFEQLHAARAPVSLDGSVAALPPRAADALSRRRLAGAGVDVAANGIVLTENAPATDELDPARTATSALQGREALTGLSALRFEDHDWNRV